MVQKWELQIIRVLALICPNLGNHNIFPLFSCMYEKAKRKFPVSGSSVGQNASLMQEVREE